MKFIKMHGLGNDFVILDHRGGGDALERAQIEALCDRHTGIGCDQLIIMEPSRRADLFMHIYNPDGTESSTCGNATRCVADLYMSEGAEKTCVIETRAGLLPCRRLESGLIEADMGQPLLDWADIPLSEARDTLNLGIGEGAVKNPVAVGMGNPHCVFFVDNLADIDVETTGQIYEYHPFFPQRTNVSFAQVEPDGAIRVRVWERGAGVTMACGSAACAVAVAGVRRGLTGRRTDILMYGGALTLEWRESDGHVLMTGPITHVFKGEMDER